MAIKVSVKQSILRLSGATAPEHADTRPGWRIEKSNQERLMRPTKSPARAPGPTAHLLETLNAIALRRCAVPTVLTSVAERIAPCRQTLDA
ncbi:MAG: hypothetical protein Q8S12_12495 [Hydrogenophaga sp.]|jgi:hypothetical protein|uniref:hypothetical protein n=1 Tax=Hydrogenophaga sp. TaxID=1904254 RepID=UPI00271F6453|nr:hypothetical protein [Hydrogenophaga sp.]MDO9505876.1 hypothetical protein [Hydrogenophaga sp.]MDP3627408.1 hypothetical protein [Hydrogenophaga sp.]